MIDPDDAAETMRSFLVERRETAGAGGYVLGVSGGLDSAVAATLAAQAVGSDRVLGMVMPGDPSGAENMRDAVHLCGMLEVESRIVDIRPAVSLLCEAAPGDPGTLAVGNLRARVRMVLEYLEANEREYLVLGAGNRSESQLGYVTKYGDGAVDVQPMGDLYKTEVAALARHLDLQDRFVEKTPTAELWEGQTDEGELGAKYETIDAILRGLDRGWSIDRVADETGYDRNLVERFAAMRENSAHKRRRPPSPEIER